MVCRKLSFWKIWSLLKSYIYIIIRIWSRTLYGIIIQKEWLLPADFHSSGYWYLSYQKINQILRERVSPFQKLKCCLISCRFRLSKENRWWETKHLSSQGFSIKVGTERATKKCNLFCNILCCKTSLCSKRFQSSYWAKVREETKKGWALVQLPRRTPRGNACHAGYCKTSRIARLRVLPLTN